MSKEYQVIEKVGDLQISEQQLSAFMGYLENSVVEQAHQTLDNTSEETENSNYNKYIMHDEIFTQIFTNDEDYNYFLKDCIDTQVLPTRDHSSDELNLRKIIGSIHAFFINYYKKYFMLQISVSITDVKSTMDYQRDLAAENADRFLIDITHTANNMCGVEVEERLYPLEQLAIYKLDATRQHRNSNFSNDHRQINFGVQCISELDQFVDYQQKHLGLFSRIQNEEKDC